MTKAQPMTVSEFAEYSAAIPKDRHEDYNRMLSFVEDIVKGRCCNLVCRHCAMGIKVEELKDWTPSGPYAQIRGWVHHHDGEILRCDAASIRIDLSSEGTK